MERHRQPAKQAKYLCGQLMQHPTICDRLRHLKVCGPKIFPGWQATTPSLCHHPLSLPQPPLSATTPSLCHHTLSLKILPCPCPVDI